MTDASAPAPADPAAPAPATAPPARSAVVRHFSIGAPAGQPRRLVTLWAVGARDVAQALCRYARLPPGELRLVSPQARAQDCALVLRKADDETLAYLTADPPGATLVARLEECLAALAAEGWSPAP